MEIVFAIAPHARTCLVPRQQVDQAVSGTHQTVSRSQRINHSAHLIPHARKATGSSEPSPAPTHPVICDSRIEQHKNHSMSEGVRAVVREIRAFPMSDDSTDFLPSSFDPDDPGHFGLWVQALIGDDSSDRCDGFDIYVCSPSWFSELMAPGKEGIGFVDVRGLELPSSVTPGAGIWFMVRWDASAVEQAIHEVCQYASPGPDWGTVASRIGRLIPWEFDYRFGGHVNKRFGDRFPPIT